MRTLFLNPPSFEGFDGGASSRWPASREIEPCREDLPAQHRVPHSGGRDHGQPIEVHTSIYYIDGIKVGHAVTRREG